MSWHKITLPLIPDAIDPQVVEIGKLGLAVYERENRPKGFAMLHTVRASEGHLNDKFLVYLSPVASEMCTEIAERYTLEPCGVPARNEPKIAWVFGDPLVKGELKENFEPEPGTIEWQWQQELEAQRAESFRLAEEAEAAAAAARAEAAQREAEQADSAQA